MQVKSIEESILQYFRPSLSNHLSLISLFCLFLGGCFRQVLLLYRCPENIKALKFPCKTMMVWLLIWETVTTPWVIHSMLNFLKQGLVENQQDNNKRGNF